LYVLVRDKMVYVGMIFQLDAEQGSGLIMFADGDKRAFGADDWVDSQNSPSIGAKVSYENSAKRVMIKAADAEDQITTAPVEVSEEEEGSAQNALGSVDEYISHYTGMGFKLVKDMQEGISRTLAFRKLEMGEPVEVIIKQTGSKIDVTKTVNGKVV